MSVPVILYFEIAGPVNSTQKIKKKKKDHACPTLFKYKYKYPNTEMLD